MCRILAQAIANSFLIKLDGFTIAIAYKGKSYMIQSYLSNY